MTDSHKTTAKLKEVLAKASKSALASKDDAEEDFQIPSMKSIEQLNELATSKLAEIVRKHVTKAPGWAGYDGGEVIAARALLDQDTQDVKR